MSLQIPFISTTHLLSVACFGAESTKQRSLWSREKDKQSQQWVETLALYYLFFPSACQSKLERKKKVLLV